jgi:endonuclease/exonuclease/phosphatase family metal-dependent hydrolase
LTTHLATLVGERGPGADPHRARAASDLRRLQCEALREVVAELRAAEAARVSAPAGAPAPLLLAGDLNAAPGSPELGLLGAADSRALRPAARPRWRSDLAESAGGEVFWTHAGRAHIDHILLDDPAGRLDLLDYLIWNDAEVETMTDHYPVVARFALASVEAG